MFELHVAGGSVTTCGHTPCDTVAAVFHGSRPETKTQWNCSNLAGLQNQQPQRSDIGVACSFRFDLDFRPRPPESFLLCSAVLTISVLIHAVCRHDTGFWRSSRLRVDLDRVAMRHAAAKTTSGLGRAERCALVLESTLRALLGTLLLPF